MGKIITLLKLWKMRLIGKSILKLIDFIDDRDSLQDLGMWLLDVAEKKLPNDYPQYIAKKLALLFWDITEGMYNNLPPAEMKALLVDIVTRTKGKDQK